MRAGHPGHDDRMDTANRLLPLIGAFNFRDLGGYPTSGGVTAWGQLFRSDTLTGLTEDDVAVLAELGLSSVIDLRTPVELEHSGRGLLAHQPVGYSHLPLVQKSGADQGAPAEAQENLVDRYLWYLEVGKESLVEALLMVGDPGRRPLVFHCAAGKDRTGVLAALVLEILGVDRPTIVADYVLTASRMDLIVSRMSEMPNAREVVAAIPQFLLRAEAETMEGFLERLDAQHGGARSWAVAAGVPDEVLAAMEESLVVPDQPAA
jgi:protein-tyrosine phosphatase